MVSTIQRPRSIWIVVFLLLFVGLPAVSPNFAETEISFDFPSEGFVFKHKDKVMLAVKVAHCSSDACGHIVMLLNDREAGRFDMQPNEYGEIRAHISVPELPDGDYTAAVKLVNEQGDDLAEHLYHDVGFVLHTQEEEEGESESSNPDLDSAYLLALMQVCENGHACSDEQQGDLKCHGRGDCYQGNCLCYSSFAGERCEHDIFNNNTYIPDADPMDSASRCIKAVAWENRTRELMRELTAASERTSCEAEHVLLFAAPPHGYGTNIHYLTVLLSKAYLEGKALVMHGAWNYDTCGGDRGFACHMQPLSACEGRVALDNGVPLHGRNDAIAWPLAGAEDSHFIPPQLRTPYHGVLWWRSQLTAFLLRPNNALQRRLREIKNLIGFRHPAIGVQVRRGDSCSHAASSTIRPGCQPTAQYLSLVQAMIDRYGRDQRITVFLATDDQAVVEEFEMAAQSQSEGPEKHSFKLVRVPVDRKLFESSLFIEYRLMLGYVDNKAVTDATMLDLFLLAQADYFVGGFGSHFSRLAFELSVGLKGRVPPYASVDYPWCFHFLERRPIGSWPEQYC